MADTNILKNAICRVGEQIQQMEAEQADLLYIINADLESKKYMQFGVRDEVIKLINKNYDVPLRGLRIELADLQEAFERQLS